MLGIGASLMVQEVYKKVEFVQVALDPSYGGLSLYRC